MTDPARAQSVDTDIAKHCAYSLPGVALTLGRQNWHCLKDTYETLASDVQVKAAFSEAHVEMGGLLMRKKRQASVTCWLQSACSLVSEEIKR